MDKMLSSGWHKQHQEQRSRSGAEKDIEDAIQMMRARNFGNYLHESRK
jgi:hypothetical protein